MVIEKVCNRKNKNRIIEKEVSIEKSSKKVGKTEKEVSTEKMLLN